MEMTEVRIAVPKQIGQYFVLDGERDSLVRNAMVLYPFIQNQTISHGKAAEFLGISKYALICLYGDLGISYLDFDISEAESEAEFYKEMKGR